MLCLEVSLGLNFVSCRNLIYLFQMKTKEDKMDHSYSIKHDPDEAGGINFEIIFKSSPVSIFFSGI